MVAPDTVDANYGVYVGNNIKVSKSSGWVGTGALRTDTNVGVSLQVGAGGTNHGVFSDVQNRWLINGDASDVYVGGMKIIDTVVEQGTSGIWTYRKWNSGFAEIWGETTYSSKAVTTTWGSDYSCNLGTLNFPFTFTSRPKGSAYAMSTSARVWIIESTDRNTAHTGTLYAIAPTTYTSIASITVYLDFTGKWK